MTRNGFVNNFAMGTVEVAPELGSNAAATIVDNQVNTTGNEALYVSQLIFPSNSTTTIDGVTIYFQQLLDGRQRSY